jgi:LEA14-like dessication related protein
MRRASVAALLVGLALSAGCAGLNQLAASAVQKPKLTFRSVSLSSLDLEGATLAFTYDLENPNGFGLNLARVGYTVDVEGARVASGDLPGGLEIKANGTAPVTFPVHVRFQDVPGIVTLLTSKKDAVKYRLGGNVGVRTPLGVLDVPMSHEGALKLPSTPQFALEGIAIHSLGFTEITFDVRLRVRNPNGFALPVGKLDYALAVGGASVARAAALDVAPVAGGSSAVVSIPVKLDVASAGRAAAQLASGGEVPVDLGGKANLAGIAFPLDLKGKVPARR